MEPRANNETAALLALLRRKPRGTSWSTLAAEVLERGSAAAVLHDAAGGSLFADPEIDADIADATQTINRWEAAGYQLVTVLEDRYPTQLLTIRDAPPFLFYQGSLIDPDPGMSIVGSRSATPGALRFASDAARLLVSQGLTVIAGLAAGIDTAAHTAALNAGGRTVAVIGTGIARTYPAANADLQHEIAHRGLVLSQFYPDAPPSKSSFPMRNVTMSGYGLATIVVEASEHSGTRIQARVAGEHGRPVILTKTVATRTRWGAALVGRPNVHVVATLDELSDTINNIRGALDRLTESIDAMAWM